MYDLSSGPNHCLLNTSYSSGSQWQSSCIILFGENVCNCPNFVYLLFNHQHTVLIKWQILAVYSCLLGFHGWVLLGLRRVSVHQVAYRVLGNCTYVEVKLCVLRLAKRSENNIHRFTDQSTSHTHAMEMLIFCEALFVSLFWHVTRPWILLQLWTNLDGLMRGCGINCP